MAEFWKTGWLIAEVSAFPHHDRLGLPDIQNRAPDPPRSSESLSRPQDPPSRTDDASAEPLLESSVEPSRAERPLPGRARQ